MNYSVAFLLCQNQWYVVEVGWLSQNIGEKWFKAACVREGGGCMVEEALFRGDGLHVRSMATATQLINSHNLLTIGACTT